MSGRASSEGHSSARFLARRRLRRRRILIALTVFSGIVLGALIYGLWQQQVRISHIVVYGANQSLADVATAAMQGSYLGIIPRNSTFFLSESSIRAPLLAAHQDIAAISIFRNGFTGLSIKVDYRVPIARWCGVSPSVQIASSTQLILDAPCYFFDASGFIYMRADDTSTVNGFIVYTPLPIPDRGLTSVTAPIGGTLPNADKLPSAFDFARQLATFGSPVSSIVFHEDEVDDYLKSGTHIGYVLGDEQNAFTAFVSAHTNFNLADGSVDYIDLRFPGKVYVKKTGSLQ